MDINIYSDYDVTIKSCYSYISDEDSIPPDDIAFRTDGGIITKRYNGVELMELLHKNLNDMYIQSFIINDNKITFEYFNPNTGEGGDYDYVINIVKQDEVLGIDVGEDKKDIS